jgi:midasin (ATPase involved in ribosome maturation)
LQKRRAEIVVNKAGVDIWQHHLIGEVGRSPAKTQSALFEVMEERQLTIDGHTYKMQEPFIVLATQNPIEQEGLVFAASFEIFSSF